MQISDTPSTCACGDVFDVDHAMVCRYGGFIIQTHSELRDLETEMLKMVCNDVQTKPILQEKKRADTWYEQNSSARHSCSWLIWERHGSAFLGVRVFYPNASPEASPQNKSTASMRVRRKECTPGFRKSNNLPRSSAFRLD